MMLPSLSARVMNEPNRQFTDNGWQNYIVVRSLLSHRAVTDKQSEGFVPIRGPAAHSSQTAKLKIFFTITPPVSITEVEST